MASDISKFTQINPLKIQHLTFKNSAKHVMLKNELIDFVIKEIQKIPNYQEQKNNLELIRFVCNMLETLITNNNENIDSNIDSNLYIMPSKWFNSEYIEQNKYKDIYPEWNNLVILDI